MALPYAPSSMVRVVAMVRSLTLHQYINTRLRADHGVAVRCKAKQTLSAESLGILLRQLWLYTRITVLGRLLLQESWVLLSSSITGTRSRVMVPPAYVLAASKKPVMEDEMMGLPPSSKRWRRNRDDFQSDIPKYIRYDDLPPTLCYRDIDLFVIRNPQGGSDVPAAVVDFRNLKGTEQGAEG